MTDTVEQQSPHSFSSLKAYLKEIISRGGDSDFDDGLAGLYINAAEKQLIDEIGVAPFLRISDSLIIPAGTSEVTMDINITDVSSFRNNSEARPLRYVERERWNEEIVDATSESGGNPDCWTKYGYSRRTNTGSPSQPYGALKVHFYPAPGSDFTVQYDAVLAAGCMVEEDDFPVVPIRYHFGLIELAAHLAGAYGLGSKAFEQHERIAMRWIRNAVVAERRSLPGNQRFVPGEYVRARSRRRLY